MTYIWTFGCIILKDNLNSISFKRIYLRNGLYLWWCHHMETFSTLLAICAGNSLVTGAFPRQRPVTQSFDVFFDLHLNKRLSKQSKRHWFETPSCSLWRHCDVHSRTHIERIDCISNVFPLGFAFEGLIDDKSGHGMNDKFYFYFLLHIYCTWLDFHKNVSKYFYL